MREGDGVTKLLGTPWRYIPWHIAEGPSEVRAAEGWLVCVTSSDDEARLIAAAPDLLAALKEAEVGLEFAGADRAIPKGDFVPTPTLALRIVRAAILSATKGE